MTIKKTYYCFFNFLVGNTKAKEQESLLKNETDVTFGKLVKQVVVSFFRAILRLVSTFHIHLEKRDISKKKIVRSEL